MSSYGQDIIPFILLNIAAAFGCSIGGVGWDKDEDVKAAKAFPTTQSDRVSTTTVESPYGTFKQEFETVFEDFNYRGNPVSGPSKVQKTQIQGTRYGISYENFVLRVFRDDNMVAERKLPPIFYMHPMSSAAVLGDSPGNDFIICRTQSRATTGLRYILIADGNGDVLFEKIMSGAEDWDITPGTNGEIIIGGGRTKTTLSIRR